MSSIDNVLTSVREDVDAHRKERRSFSTAAEAIDALSQSLVATCALDKSDPRSAFRDRLTRVAAIAARAVVDLELA